MIELDYRALTEQVLGGVATAIIIATLAFIFRNSIIRGIKKLRPQLESRTPHINFEISSQRVDEQWVSLVTISNASDEPAYNLYVYYFEQFSTGNFKLTASKAEGLITRSVLGVRDSLKFEIDGVQFDGCNVTCSQEVWIEYENSLGVAFRVVNIPPSPRGDIARIMPPKVVKRRMELLPGVTIEGGEKEAKEYIKGKRSALPRHGIMSRCIWALKEWRLKLFGSNDV